MSRRHLEYLDHEAYVNGEYYVTDVETNSSDEEDNPWEDMTDEEILAGTCLSPIPTVSIQTCLVRLVEETNDQGFTCLFVSDLVQAAYEIYTEDRDWEEWKDTCTRFLASLRGRPAEPIDDSSDEKDTEYDMMVDLNEQCARVFNAEDFVTTAEVDLEDLTPTSGLTREIAYNEAYEETRLNDELSVSGETLSEFTYSSSESDDSEDDDYYYVNHYKVEDVDGHSYTQGEFSDYYGLSWREHWDAALDRSVLLYLRVLFSEDREVLVEESYDHYYDSYEEYDEKELRTNTWTSISSPWQKTCNPREYYETIMGRSYVEPNDSDDWCSDYHNDLDSDEEAFWKSIALKEEKDFDDVQTDQVLGGTVAQEEESVSYLNSDTSEETNFRSRYPYLATSNHQQETLMILDNNSAQELLNGINMCQCCDRHQINRPTTISSTQFIDFHSNHTYEEQERLRQECDCPCRSFARSIYRRMRGE